MASKKYKFLLMYGQSRKKVEIVNETGASKRQLSAAVVEKFGIQHCELQVWDEDFDEFVDIEDEDLLMGPKKIQIILTNQNITPSKKEDVVPVTLYKNTTEFADGTTSSESTSRYTKNTATFTDSNTSYPARTSESSKNTAAYTDTSYPATFESSKNTAVDTSYPARTSESSKNTATYTDNSYPATFDSSKNTAVDTSYPATFESSKNMATFTDTSFPATFESSKNMATFGGNRSLESIPTSSVNSAFNDVSFSASTYESSKNTEAFTISFPEALSGTSFRTSTSSGSSKNHPFIDTSFSANTFECIHVNPAEFCSTSSLAIVPTSYKNSPLADSSFSASSESSRNPAAFDGASSLARIPTNSNSAIDDASFSASSESSKNSPLADSRSFASTSTGDVCVKWPSTNWFPDYQIPRFPQEITQKIMTGEPLTASNDKTILDIIYESVKLCTVYPTSSQYHGIVDQLLARHPKLFADMDTWSNQQQLWLTKLKYKFQNGRKRDINVRSTQAVQIRKRKEPSDPRISTIKTKNVRYPPAAAVKNYLPHCSSYDAMTIQQHVEWLKEENYKVAPNLGKVSARMDITFADRRDAIVHYRYPDIMSVEVSYPWLFRDNGNELLDEFQRIHGECSALDLVRSGLEKYAPMLIFRYKNQRTKNTCRPDYHSDLMTFISESERIGDKDLAIAKAALVIIPVLLYEPNFIFTYQGDVKSCADVYVETDAKYPFTSQYFTLFVKGTKVCRVNDLITAFACYLSAFYVFHIKSISTLQKTLEFCQVALMDITDKFSHVEQSVLTLIARLNKGVALTKKKTFNTLTGSTQGTRYMCSN